MDDLILLADQLAEKAHAGQIDKAGAPYIGHPRAVAALCSGPKEKITALLHDVLEDTEMTADELRPLFGKEITGAVETLTHREGETYFAYIERVRQNPLAAVVKRADLMHNMDLSRLPRVTEKDRARLEKYRKAFAMLTQNG